MTAPIQDEHAWENDKDKAERRYIRKTSFFTLAFDTHPSYGLIANESTRTSNHQRNANNNHSQTPPDYGGIRCQNKI